MKKFILPIAAIALTLGFGACSNDKDEPGTPTPPPTPEQSRSNGAFIVNAGSMYSNIDGSLEYIDYSTNNVINDVFKSVNQGQTIGDTFNDGYILDDEIYLAVTDSKVLHIIDREDYKLEKTISTADYNGGPRHITSYNGMIYMTLFGMPGYLAEVDPEKEEITRTLEVGPLPEYVCAFNDMLYVAVSDGYGDGSQACVAVVDPKSFTVTKRITGVVNPVNLVTNGTQLFVCAWGQYMSEPPYSQYNYGAYEIVNNTLSEKICDATDIWIKDNYLYYISFPYGFDNDTLKYGLYNTSTKEDTSWIDSKDGVDYPVGGAVDPSSGDVFILSYELGEGGFASYSTPGYVKRYKADGTFVARYQTGVGPVSMFFNVYE